MHRLDLFKLEHIDRDKTSFIIWSISIAIIFVGIVTSILLYRANRDLWIDEAMLAYSFNTRSFFNLTSSIFEWEQSAPVLYLYSVKIITIIFGTSETTLRILSFFSYIATLIVSYVLMNKAFKVKYPVMCVAFISTMSELLYYSNEFKPYMNDCFSVLLVLYFYYLYREKKIKLITMSAIYAAILWLSYPTIFFIGGVFIYEFINGIRNKDKNSIIRIILAGSAALISFSVQYVVWLKPVANSEYMINFWEDYKFPLIPKGIEDINRLVKLSGELVASMKFGIILISSLIVAGVVVSIIRKNKYGCVIIISIFLVLTASYMGKYPFYQRLMLFIYPLFAISIFIAIDAIMEWNSDLSRNVVIMILIVAVFMCNYRSAFYLQESRRYRETEEVSKLIEYVDENIKEDQKLYVYYYTIPVFSFKNGYSNMHIGENVDEKVGNVVFGEKFSEDETVTGKP